jgi:hypothetical protein
LAKYLAATVCCAQTEYMLMLMSYLIASSVIP